MTQVDVSESVPVVEGQAVLEVRDLAVEFRTRDGVVNAVNGISYSVGRGETLAILGESGSGKSVSAQAVMGILDSPPGFITSGEILFRGQDLLTMNAEDQRRLRHAYSPGAVVLLHVLIGRNAPAGSPSILTRSHRVDNRS